MIAAYIALALIAGGLIGWYVLPQLLAQRKIRAATDESERIIKEAQTEQKKLMIEAKEQSIKGRAEIDMENRGRRQEFMRLEKRISQKEENLERRTDGVDKRYNMLKKK
jgi:ribonuclease Y